jgi:DUF4097 and DUF4098 domain-containing protein YvlB
VTGSVNVKSASGDVRLRNVGGSVSAQSASGDIQVDVVGGPVSIATASGDLQIGEAHDDVSANTVSGDQDHGVVTQGRLNATSVSGDISIGVRRGSKVHLDCNTVSGDTTSELELTSDAPAGDGPLVEIRAKTVSGDIRITRAAAPTTNDGSSDTVQEVHA